MYILAVRYKFPTNGRISIAEANFLTLHSSTHKLGKRLCFQKHCTRLHLLVSFVLIVSCLPIGIGHYIDRKILGQCVFNNISKVWNVYILRISESILMKCPVTWVRMSPDKRLTQHKKCLCKQAKFLTTIQSLYGGQVKWQNTTELIKDGQTMR